VCTDLLDKEGGWRMKAKSGSLFHRAQGAGIAADDAAGQPVGIGSGGGNRHLDGDPVCLAQASQSSRSRGAGRWKEPRGVVELGEVPILSISPQASGARTAQAAQQLATSIKASEHTIAPNTIGHWTACMTTRANYSQTVPVPIHASSPNHFRFTSRRSIHGSADRAR